MSFQLKQYCYPAKPLPKYSDPVVLIRTADGQCTILAVEAESFSVPKNKTQEGSGENDMDVLFDEYGDSLPSGKQESNEKKTVSNSDESNANGHSGKDDGAADNGDGRKGFRNCSIERKFNYQLPSSSTQFINSACLFEAHRLPRPFVRYEKSKTLD